MLTIASPAPAFTLPDQDGTPVALQDLRGRWVVLYFYPKDDTPGCTVEACEFTAALPQFRGLDAEVFGCSADGAAAHTKFVAKYKLGIRLLTDADRSVMKTYGAFGTKLMYGKKVEGVIRSTVLIAPDGTVAHHWPTVKAAGHAEQVRSKLAELQGQAPQPVTKAPKAAATRASSKKPAAKKPAAKKAVAERPAAKKAVATKAAAKPRGSKK
ncbi:MAG: peroxiredoxin [Planctomycetes bacterium]|nr:peroxiredoxin [Planctomycetota bacterium]